MQPKKILAAGALSVMLAGGGVAGALLGLPGVSGATTAQATTTTAPAAEPAPSGPEQGRQGRGGIEAAAKALGLSVEDLRSQLRGGQTIAEVAKAKSVDLQPVIDAMVAAESAAIDQHAAEAKAGLPERVADQVNGKFEGHRRGRGLRIGLGTAAKVLGVSEVDLRAELKNGKTLAAMAVDKGVDVKKLIGAMTTPVTERIDRAVADGKLTAAEATQRKADATERITSFVNEGPRDRPGNGHRPRR